MPGPISQCFGTGLERVGLVDQNQQAQAGAGQRAHSAGEGSHGRNLGGLGDPKRNERTVPHEGGVSGEGALNGHICDQLIDRLQPLSRFPTRELRQAHPRVFRNRRMDGRFDRGCYEAGALADQQVLRAVQQSLEHSSIVDHECEYLAIFCSNQSMQPMGQVGGLPRASSRVYYRALAPRATGRSDPWIMPSVMADPSLLSLPAFRNYWFGRLATTAANQIFSLVIGWELYEITGSAWYLGMAGLVQFLPVLFAFAIAGDLADRLDRRWILVVVLLAHSGLGAVLLGASVADRMSVELLLGVTVLIGLLRPFQMASTQALTALLVPPAVLTRAVALGSGGSQAMFIAGPALGGFVLIAGPAYVYGLVTAVSLLAAFCFFLARYHFVKPEPRPFSWVQLFGGFGFLWRERALLGVISLDLFAVMLASVTALLPVFAKDVLQVDAWGLGLLRSAPAVGAVIVSVILARWSIQRRAGKLMLGNVALFSVALLGFAFSEHLLLSLLLLALSGAADMVSVVIRQTMLQIDTPDAMRGRVSAVSSLAISGSNQLGDFRAGIVAHWIGASGAVATGAVAGVLVALLWARWFPEIWRRERLDQK